MKRHWDNTLNFKQIYIYIKNQYKNDGTGYKTFENINRLCNISMDSESEAATEHAGLTPHFVQIQEKAKAEGLCKSYCNPV